MNRTDAERAIAILRQANDLVSSSVGQVHALTPETPYLVYRSLAANIMGALFDLVDPLWREWPDLEPEIMKQPGGYDPAHYRVTRAAASEMLTTMATLEEHLLRLEEQVRSTGVQEDMAFLGKKLAEIRELKDRVVARALRDVPEPKADALDSGTA